MTAEPAAPVVFVSYSHDSQEHKDWVLTLASRLVANGVDVILDQWNLTLGSDLPRFMEAGLTGAQRVLAVCSEPYVTKANRGVGGVGYEKMILTAQLMENITTDRIVPIIRNNPGNGRLPTFLGSRLYVDFRDDTEYERRYAELLRDIHGVRVQPRPALGPNPFAKGDLGAGDLRLSERRERYVSPPMRGTVTFDYSNNNGNFVLGVGELAFTTHWTSASNTSIHAYGSPSAPVALAAGASASSDIDDARQFDASSRSRTPRVGEIVIWRNESGYFAAVRIDQVSARSHGGAADQLTISYLIQSNGSASFRDL